MYVIVKQTQTKNNKGFNVDNKFVSQNWEDFLISIQNIYWLSQKVKQLEDDSSKGILFNKKIKLSFIEANAEMNLGMHDRLSDHFEANF